ncbi:MAG: hypothetical protein A2X06_13340 [Bacteroidetes bacterium GWC2_40_22]|nr:MAG: hypothetical protein A2X06_13340 [Bacteroidetes bacterium GWC2_40_22]
MGAEALYALINPVMFQCLLTRKECSGDLRQPMGRRGCLFIEMKLQVNEKSGRVGEEESG